MVMRKAPDAANPLVAKQMLVNGLSRAYVVKWSLHKAESPEDTLLL
ncbi:hypothetical protein GI364_24815 (plasmid) [Alicyclobacillus sp. SO9]|nr:hypothetical protein GI364_24815 [Alicyclobacillus sp. SO9]